MSKERDAERYRAAMHGVQTAIAYELGRGDSKECEPKHLRVGINSAMVDSGAIVELLIEKGVFTWDEFYAKLADKAEAELASYQARNPQNITFK